MSHEFWWSIFLSLPIGILINLFTPKLQSIWEKSGKNWAIKRTKNMEAEYRQILDYRKTPHTFSDYLLITVLRTTLVGAFATIISGLAYSIGNNVRLAFRFMDIDSIYAAGDNLRQFEANFDLLQSVLYIVGDLIAVIGAILIINICRKAFDDWYRIKNFEEYEKNVKQNLASLNANSDKKDVS